MGLLIQTPYILFFIQYLILIKYLFSIHLTVKTMKCHSTNITRLTREKNLKKPTFKYNPNKQLHIVLIILEVKN